MTVRLSASASEALRIPIAVNPRSGDFTVAGLTDGGLSFSSGAERQTFTIAANQDDDWDDEEVTLGFGTPLPEGVSAGDPARATVTLFDDDDAPGEVTVRPATAQVGTELTATLSDADEVAEVTGWQWHRRASDQAAWTAISGATAAAYTPVSADAGQYLQATVGYTDGHGPDKSAESAAIGPVQATGPTERTVWFGKESYEASEGGAAETVTVRLSRAATEVLRIPISVDPRSGPFTLAGLGTDTTLTIASGISGTFTIRADQDADRVDETVALGFRDLPSGVVAGTPSSATVTLIDDDELLIVGASDTTFAENGTGVVATYTATDANGHTVTWSIHADGQRPANADSTHFSMGSRNGQLTFRATPDFAAPDFEDPDDTGHDNVYLVTVQATDNGTPPASTLHDVSVRVTNVDEPGQIEFRSTRPEVGVQLLAAVTDPDGNVDVRSQQWEREDGNGGWEDVGQASERDHSPPSTYPGHVTYTPVTADVGKRLRVTVGYLDGASADDQDRESVQSDEMHPVVATAPPPPVRRLEILGAADTTFAERATGLVAPYVARYTDGTAASSVTWTLSGADASDTLALNGDGELRFTKEPDYEHPKDADGDNVWSVIVEAAVTGPPAMDTTLAVSVRITNEDDPGTVSMSPNTPQVGQTVLGTLIDSDGGIDQSQVDWIWFTVQAGREARVDPGTGATNPYLVPSSAAGHALRVRAEYDDAHGPGKMATSSPSKTVKPRRLRVEFDPNSYNAVEGGDAVTVTVRMTPAADRFVHVPIRFQPSSGDYSETLGNNNRLSFELGDRTKTFTITATSDSDRDDETVTLGFGDLPAEVVTGTPASATVNLDDTTPAPNRPPEIDDMSDPSVRENTPSVATFTATATATDPEGQAITWSVSGNVFSIGETSGEVSFQTAPNYESGTTSYSLTVRATDTAGASDTETVTVNVTDVDEPPGPPSNVRVSAAGRTSVEVEWDAPNTSGRPPVTDYDVQYRASGNWRTHSFSGTGTSTTISSLDPNTAYEVQVNATNDEGTSGWAAGSGRTDCGAPTISGPTSQSIPENTTAVASYSLSDPDGGGGSWLPLAGTDASSFHFSSGTLSFRSAPDYETDSRQYQVTIRAQGGCSKTASRAVTVNVTNVVTPRPTVTLSVPSSGGHENLDASWTVPSSGASITGYELQYCTSGARDDGESPANSGGQDPSARAVCSTNSFGSGTTSTTLSGLRSGTLYSATARATSSEGTGAWSAPTSATTRSNTAPVISGTGRQNVNENTTAVGTYTATDAEGDGITWDIYSTDSDKFSFASSGSSLTLRFELAPDYENPTDANTNNIYVVRIRATDDANPSANKQQADQRHRSGHRPAQPDDGREGERAFVRDGQTRRQLVGPGQRRDRHRLHHEILLRFFSVGGGCAGGSGRRGGASGRMRGNHGRPGDEHDADGPA